MNARTRSTLLLLALPVLAAACSNLDARNEATARRAEAAVTDVVIRTFDYQFDAPATIPAGPTRLKLVNAGPDIHHVQLVRLEGGHTLKDLMNEFRGGEGPLPAWAVQVGGPNAVLAGAPSGDAIVDLKPGRYALLCFVPAPDGVPHVMKGMIRGIEVTPASERAFVPSTDAEISLSDYGFDVNGALASGQHTIRVENAATQPHELVVFRMQPGRTAQEMVQWIATRQGPPPGAPVGGVTYLSAGEVNTFTMEFAAGDYAFICFVPDHKDGKPHFMHGMMRDIKVQ